jgi:hypothetical protein
MLKTGFLLVFYWRLGVTRALVALTTIPRPSSFLLARLLPVMFTNVSLFDSSDVRE